MSTNLNSFEEIIYMSDLSYEEKEALEQKTIVNSVIKVGLCVVLLICLAAWLLPLYGRYQAIQTQLNDNAVKLSAENNQIQVNELQIQQTEQLVKVEQQKAQIRAEEAKGIAVAQELINKTLTDRYLQHEAIDAQLKMAGSPNHTQIYIPTGNNGIPLVKTIE